MESKTGYFVKVGIDCILEVLRHIGMEVIRMGQIEISGVDLAREERMRNRDMVLE